MKKNLLLKVLIIIGLLLLFGLVYRSEITPTIDTYRESRLDGERMETLEKLDLEVSKAVNSNNEYKKSVFLSIPSSTLECKNIDLPKLTTGWKYYCLNTPENTISIGKKTWLPFETNNPYLMDSNDDPKLLKYFALYLDENKYALATTVSGKEFSDSSLPIGVYMSKKSSPEIYYAANNISYHWPMSDGSTEFITNKFSAAAGVPLEITDITMWTDNGCIGQKYCIQLNSSADRVYTSLTEYKTKTPEEFSYSFWVKINSIPEWNYQLFNPGLDRLDVNIEGKTGSIFGWHEDQTKGSLIYKSKPEEYTDDKWHLIVMSKGKKKTSMYIDGVLKGKILSEEKFKSANGNLLLSASNLPRNSNVKASNLIIYSKELLPNEVLSLYKSQK